MPNISSEPVTTLMPGTTAHTRWTDRVSFAVVSGYLIAVYLFLVMRGRLALPFSPRRALTVLLRGRVRGEVSDIRHVRGHCYAGTIDRDLPSDPPDDSSSAAGGALRLTEEASPLSPVDAQAISGSSAGILAGASTHASPNADPRALRSTGHLSQIKLHEGETMLLLAHSPVVQIIEHGYGRFRHVGRTIYFSSSDGTSPITNRRRYHFVD